MPPGTSNGLRPPRSLLAPLASLNPLTEVIRRASAASGDSRTLDPHALRARVPLSLLASLHLPALHRIALRAPAQHASGKIGDVIESRALQQHRGLSRTGTRAAHRDNRAIAGKLCCAR